MIKTLQKKFVITAMIAVTVLIVVLLGAVNVLNYVRVRAENEGLLSMILQNEKFFYNENMAISETDEIPEGAGMANAPELEGLEPPIDNPPWKQDEKKNPKMDFFNKHITEDTAMSARYFIVKFDSNNDIAYVDTSRISSVTEEEAIEYASDIIDSGEDKGSRDNFIFQISHDDVERGKTLVCLYTSGQTKNILWVLFVSVAIGVFGWSLMLVLVIVLSKKAIRPIAQNMEKQKVFVSDAGHEIKTPLAIIMANIDAMELHNGENKWSKNIRSQTNRLSGLMTNLLTLSKMEDLKNTAKKSIDVSKLVQDNVEDFFEYASSKGLEIKNNVEENIIYSAEEEHINQLISILLDNAVKYSIEKGDICISLEKNPKGFNLKVSNPCEKVEKDLNVLFDRFYRGDEARTQKNGGYGIGLSLARAIVENYNGTIRAEYENGIITFTVDM